MTKFVPAIVATIASVLAALFSLGGAFEDYLLTGMLYQAQVTFVILYCGIALDMFLVALLAVYLKEAYLEAKPSARAFRRGQKELAELKLIRLRIATEL